jgi:hypothetical protein
MSTKNSKLEKYFSESENSGKDIKNLTPENEELKKSAVQ